MKNLIISDPDDMNYKISKDILDLTIFFKNLNKEEISKSNIQKFSFFGHIEGDLSFLPSSVREISLPFTTKIDINSLPKNIESICCSELKYNIEMNSLNLKKIILKEIDLNFLDQKNLEILCSKETQNIQKNINKLKKLRIINIQSKESVYIDWFSRWVRDNYDYDIFSFKVDANPLYIHPKDKELYSLVNGEDCIYAEKNKLIDSI